MTPYQPAYERIANDLARRIREGEWPPDSRLPSLPELAAEYGVTSVMPVRQALTMLRAMGLIYNVQGVGNHVTNQATPGG